MRQIFKNAWQSGRKSLQTWTESKSREADALGRAVESIKFAGEHKLGRVRGGKWKG